MVLGIRGYGSGKSVIGRKGTPFPTSFGLSPLPILGSRRSLTSDSYR